MAFFFPGRKPIGIHLVAKTWILPPETPVSEIFPALRKCFQEGSMVPKISNEIMETSAAESNCASLAISPMKTLQ